MLGTENIALRAHRNAAVEAGVPVLIGRPCLALAQVACRSCGEACTTGAIRFRSNRGGVATPLLTLDRCDGCGVCLRPCPVGAISVALAA